MARALELSDDPAALAAVRGRIEQAFETSAYGDAAGVAHDLETAYRKVVGQRAVSAGKVAAA